MNDDPTTNTPNDDVEGHKRMRSRNVPEGTGDDVEGHKRRIGRNVPEGETDEDDTEGHRFRRG